ncbi:MAG: hypothetical protein PHQ12_05915 [Chthoniobacteraceae bacterium]|nr:hypothetical protein [Chthoniobacteraceae bacterium]
MSPEQKLERIAMIAEELTVLQRVPREAAAVLDREMERLAAFHTEKCCDPRLSPEQSARHKEARALARGLSGFFEKRKAALKEEMGKLRRA